MKVCLVTLAVGEQYLNQYNELFRKSQESYANKCGYDFRIITEFIDSGLKHPDTITFNKILVCSLEWSKNYDFIIFIDADILIRKNSPALHSLMNYENCIGIVDEFSQPTNEKRLELHKRMGWESNATEYYKLCGFDIETNMIFNSGLLVLQPRIHKEFLENIYSKHVLQNIGHWRGYHYEQSAIGYEIQKSKLYKVLDNKFNAVWGIEKLYSDDKTKLEDFFNNNHFTHFAGKTDYDKVKRLQ
jgi:lipopolysaccharide biosynthesis glycosyltransferase